MAPCTAQAAYSFGIYYLDDTTIELTAYNATANASKEEMAFGATSWFVLDGNEVQVATGTMTDSVETVTVMSGTSFVGGSTRVPGYFTLYTNSGTNDVVVGNFVICPTTRAQSKLYVLNTSSDGGPNIAAWCPGAQERESYGFDGTNEAALITVFGEDTYFGGPQDSTRPHLKWISSNVQPTYPTMSPTPTQWASMASAMVTAGYTGAYYECPANELTNSGWPFADIISYWNECAAAILAEDSTAHILGWCSAGIFSNGEETLANLASFLSGATSTVSGFTNHMENSHQNMSNIVMLREYWSAIQAQFTTSGFPDLRIWTTETGISGSGNDNDNYAVLQPRREARQRTVFRFVMEEFGWPKESDYQYPTYDQEGSQLATYMIDVWPWAVNTNGNLRAGIYAMHVQAEALFGKPATPTKVNFGPTGSMGDSMFAGLYYTGEIADWSGVVHNCLVLTPNGIESASVIVGVNVPGPVTYWDGWGNPGSLTVTDGQITVPVNDLLTYVFFPS